VPLSGLSDAQGGASYFKITVPPGVASLSISTWWAVDCDLYVRHGNLPTLGSYDSRSARTGNGETVFINNL